MEKNLWSIMHNNNPNHEENNQQCPQIASLWFQHQQYLLEEMKMNRSNVGTHPPEVEENNESKSQDCTN